MARPLTLYLLAYNSLQSLGWSSRLLHSSSLFPPRSSNLTSLFSLRALALARVLGSFVSDKTIHGAYVSAGDLICFLQTIAFVEVLHAAFGLVPSGAMLALMQWGGRTHFLLAIIRQIPEVQHLPSVFITFLAWSMSEAIRYPHYALSCIGISLSWLTYLRYTAFIVLYPIGLAAGEMWLMYQALPFIKERNLYAKFFSKLAISYYYFVLVVLIFYPFLWLKLYLHLFKQRRSKLGKHRKMKKV